MLPFFSALKGGREGDFKKGRHASRTSIDENQSRFFRIIQFISGMSGKLRDRIAKYVVNG